LNPLVARAWRISLRPRVRFGVVGAALLVLAAAWGLAQAPDPTTGRRVGRGYFELCRAELIGLLLIVGTSAAAAIASERQEGTWDALAASPLSDTDLVLGKAAGVLLPATLLASLLIPVHLACGVAWGAPWAMIVGVHAIFLGASLIAAGLSLLCSAVCHRVLHAVALAAAAIVLGWFATLDGLANAWTTTRFARIGQPLRLLDDLVTSSVSVEVAELRLIAFLLAAGLAGGLALLGTIRLARCSVQGRALALPGLFRARPGETDSVWDEPVYWRECRSRGARRTLRIGGLLILGLAIFLTFTNRDRAAGGFWAQIVGLSSNYTSMLIQAGMLLLCLRASVTVADERRRGMLAPLTLAGIGPARLVWSKLKGDLRPAVLLTATVVIIWITDTGTITGGFVNPRLWWAGVGVLTAVAAGYFLAVSLGLLASAYAPSPRIALLAGPGLLFAWGSAGPVLPEFVRLVWPQTSPDTQIRIWHLIGGNAHTFLGILTKHVARFEPNYPASWVVSWVAATMLAGLAAWIATVFRVSREHGQPQSRSAGIPPKAA
jgi:ABC-type transport system involved in multi-copper enzyme maturation permease subunit